MSSLELKIQYLENLPFINLYKGGGDFYPFIKNFIDLFGQDLKKFSNVYSQTFIYYERMTGKSGISVLLIKVPLNDSKITFVYNNKTSKIKIYGITGNFSKILLSCSVKYLTDLFLEAEKFYQDNNYETNLKCAYTFNKTDKMQAIQNKNNKKFTIKKMK